MVANISSRQIAKQTHCSRNTVSKAISAARDKGIRWEEVKEKTESDVEELLFGRKTIEALQQQDFEAIVPELDKPGVNKTLLWKEYTEACQAAGTIPYKHSQFFELMNQMNWINTPDHRTHFFVYMDLGLKRIHMMKTMSFLGKK